jgi:hypothetical protein
MESSLHVVDPSRLGAIDVMLDDGGDSFAFGEIRI